jgi:hypothetical protein
MLKKCPGIIFNEKLNHLLITNRTSFFPNLFICGATGFVTPLEYFVHAVFSHQMTYLRPAMDISVMDRVERNSVAAHPHLMSLHEAT